MCDGWYTERPKMEDGKRIIGSSGQVAQPAPDYSLEAVRAKNRLTRRVGLAYNGARKRWGTAE